MGIYDRDWYKDHAKNRDKPGSSSRPDSASSEPQPPATPRKEVGFEIFGDWHWSLIAIFWVFLALVLALGLKFLR